MGRHVCVREMSVYSHNLFSFFFLETPVVSRISWGTRTIFSICYVRGLADWDDCCRLDFIAFKCAGEHCCGKEGRGWVTQILPPACFISVSAYHVNECLP